MGVIRPASAASTAAVNAVVSQGKATDVTMGSRERQSSRRSSYACLGFWTVTSVALVMIGASADEPVLFGSWSLRHGRGAGFRAGVRLLRSAAFHPQFPGEPAAH